MTMAGDLMTSGCVDGRASAMSECGNNMEDGQGRRMSDPVRPLDRNFGVGGQISRHRSFSNLQGGAGAGRMPLHQQQVRGQEGFMNQQQYMNQVRQITREVITKNFSHILAISVTRK